MYLINFARYVKTGDVIPHPSREEHGPVTSVHFTPAEDAPGRPWGVMSGWMQNPDNPSESWGWSYPADQLLFIERKHK
jgi:hypothetical protein